MADVLFESGKYTLQPVAREKPAKLAGIVLSHPGLGLTAEGHTDSTGSVDFNQRLSVRRKR
jgi:outer membrane protein OmpA-like peptidoglycan-associated protein